MKKTVGIIMGILGVIVFAVGIVTKIKEKNVAARSISIIGGADGPTSIFVAGKVGGDFSAGAIIIGVILFIAAGIILFKKKR